MDDDDLEVARVRQHSKESRERLKGILRGLGTEHRMILLGGLSKVIAKNDPDRLRKLGDPALVLVAACAAQLIGEISLELESVPGYEYNGGNDHGV